MFNSHDWNIHIMQLSHENTSATQTEASESGGKLTKRNYCETC